MRYTKKDKVLALARIRNLVKAGDTVYVTLNHVSRTGMSRDASVYAVQNNVLYNITQDVAILTDNSLTRLGGVLLRGCGVDVGLQLVYNLSRVLYPAGFDCLGRDNVTHFVCGSNDHTNGDDNYKPHHHLDGGYALRHRWI